MIDYLAGRAAFGQRIAYFQNIQLALATMLTEIEVTQVYLDDAVLRLNRGEPSAVAAKAKWWNTEMHKRGLTVAYSWTAATASTTAVDRDHVAGRRR